MHPFEDGNGRIARALTEMLLAQSDGSPRRFYSMASYIKAHRSSYYEAIEHAQKGSMDVTPWLTWFLAAVKASIETSQEEFEAVLRRSDFRSSIGSVPLNERQRKVLTLLASSFEGKLTAKKWAKLCKVSPDTALRDIYDLIEKGVLARDPAGGRSTSYSLRQK
ncbi:MAG: Fic family protein [Eggerthellaceae bacterium]|nr:Fic family protein [Eggerthellaceae bacterium]